MADVSSGPVSSLPGSSHEVPTGATCDNHPDRPATRRVQGETDSFGCEYLDLCAECIERDRQEEQERLAEERRCDWCKEMKTGLRYRRDYEEGLAGRVYEVCGDCIKRESDALAAEADYWADWGDDGDYDDD